MEERQSEVVSYSSFRMCDSGTQGTACFVTGVFGFVAASQVVSMIAKNELKKPRILKSHTYPLLQEEAS
jgi:tRNA A37 threonylcarbamoyladenosine dehydratase